MDVCVLFDNGSDTDKYAWIESEFTLEIRSTTWVKLNDSSIPLGKAFYFVIASDIKNRFNVCAWLLKNGMNVLTLHVNGNQIRHLFAIASDRRRIFRVFEPRYLDYPTRQFVDSVKNASIGSIHIHCASTQHLNDRLYEEIGGVLFIMNFEKPRQVQSTANGSAKTITLVFNFSKTIVTLTLQTALAETHEITAFDGGKSNMYTCSAISDNFSFLDRFGISYIQTFKQYLNQVRYGIVKTLSHERRSQVTHQIVQSVQFQ